MRLVKVALVLAHCLGFSTVLPLRVRCNFCCKCGLEKIIYYSYIVVFYNPDFFFFFKKKFLTNDGTKYSFDEATSLSLQCFRMGVLRSNPACLAFFSRVG